VKRFLLINKFFEEKCFCTLLISKMGFVNELPRLCFNSNSSVPFYLLWFVTLFVLTFDLFVGNVDHIALVVLDRLCPSLV